MRTRYVLSALLLLALPAAAAAQKGGTVEGTVRFTGTVPPPEKILTTDGATILHNDLVVDKKSTGLRYVAVILEGAPERPKADKAGPAVLDQRDMVFTPRVVAVRHGQAVRFENNDLCNHSVMAQGASPANRFNVFAGPTQPVTHVFDPEKNPVRVGCSLHGWMRAWVFVVPHPWFAVSDERGKFRISDVPPGDYKLWLRHPDTGLQHRMAVTVKAGETASVNHEWQKVK
jgi:plastocyanin